MKKSNHKNNLLIKSLLVTVGLFAFSETYAQIGIGTISPNASSQLDIVATDKGVLIPRISLKGTTDTTTIINGNVIGLLVFNTNVAADVTQGFYYWDGTKWARMASTTSTGGGTGGVVTSGTGAPTGTNPANPVIGNIYIDENGNIYTYTAAGWRKVSNTYIGAGTPTVLAGVKAGDLYIDNNTKQISIYDGTAWQKQNVVSNDTNNAITKGLDGLAFLSKTALSGTAGGGVTAGAGAPTTSPANPPNPVNGNIYVDSSTGVVYTYVNNKWSSVATTSSGAGVPTPTNPTGSKVGDIFVNTLTGDIYTFNGTTTWQKQNIVSKDANNIIINGVGDGLAYLSKSSIEGVIGVSSGNGIPDGVTAPNPKAGDIYVNEKTGDIYTYSGTPTNAWTNTTTTSSGTADPTKTPPPNALPGDTYANTTNGQLYIFNGTNWISTIASVNAAASGPSKDTGNILTPGKDGLAYLSDAQIKTAAAAVVNGVSKDSGNILTNGKTDGLAFLSDAAIKGAAGISSGAGIPSAATVPNTPAVGNVYVNSLTGDVYTYTLAGWTNTTTTSVGTTAPTTTAPAGAMPGDIYVNSTTGTIYTYSNGVWTNQTGVSKEANNILTNSTVDGLAYLNKSSIEGVIGVSSGNGVPSGVTTPNPKAGDIYVNEKTGDIYTFTGPPTNAWTNITTTSSGTADPTITPPANALPGDIYANTTNNQLYVFNGTNWISTAAANTQQKSGPSTDTGNILTPGKDGLSYLSDAQIKAAAAAVVNGVSSEPGNILTNGKKDGLAYLNDAAIKGAAGISSGAGIPTATTAQQPAVVGNVYVNSLTGDVYTYTLAGWTSVTTTSSGAGAPTATVPAGAMAGDLYVNTANGDLYTYINNAWQKQNVVSTDANNAITKGADGLAFLSKAALSGTTTGVTAGAGAPTTSPANPPNPVAGNVYVNSTTGDIYTYSGTSWTNVTTTSSGAGVPTTTGAIKGDIYVNTDNGDIYTYNGTTWESQSGVSKEANNILTNSTIDGLAFLSKAALSGATGVSTGAGAPTNSNPPSPAPGNVYVNTTTGDIYTYSGTSWTNVTTTSSGAGLPATIIPAGTAIKGDIYVNTDNGDIYSYNGTAWENQSGVSKDAGNILTNGADGLAFLNKATVEGFVGVSSGVGVPNGTTTPNPKAGDIYVNESTGDIYTYTGAPTNAWTNVTTLSSGTADPTVTPPANALTGDVYANTSNGQIYIYDGTKWISTTAASTALASGPSKDVGNILTKGGDGLSFLSQTQINAAVTAAKTGVSLDAGNILTNGGDGLAFLSQAGIKKQAGISSNPGIPTSTTAPLPKVGDVYVNSDTGDIYTYSGTSWTNVTTTSSGVGAPTTTGAIKGDIYVNTDNGDIYTYNGTTWESQSGVSKEAGNILTNSTVDGLAFLSKAAISGAFTGLTTGTLPPTSTATTGAVVGNIYTDANGNVYTYTATGWRKDSNTFVGIIAPVTIAGATTGDIYVNSATGDIYTLNGTTWKKQNVVSNDANNAITVGGDGLAFLNKTTLLSSWNEAGTTKPASSNTQNIYQMGNVGIGTSTPSSSLQTAGPIATPVVLSTADITLDNTHSVVRINTLGGNKTVTLPAANSAPGRMYTIIKTDLSTNRIVFSTPVMLGDVTFTECNVQATYKIQSDGTNWILLN